MAAALQDGRQAAHGAVVDAAVGAWPPASAEISALAASPVRLVRPAVAASSPEVEALWQGRCPAAMAVPGATAPAGRLRPLPLGLALAAGPVDFAAQVAWAGLALPAARGVAAPAHAASRAVQTPPAFVAAAEEPAQWASVVVRVGPQPLAVGPGKPADWVQGAQGSRPRATSFRCCSRIPSRPVTAVPPLMRARGDALSGSPAATGQDAAAPRALPPGESGPW